LAPVPARRWLEAEVKIEILGFSWLFLLCLIWVILKFETKFLDKILQELKLAFLNFGFNNHSSQ